MNTELTLKEQIVLEKRFLEKQTLENVGKFFNVTRERIRQIEAKAIEKLRHLNKELDKDLRVNIIKLFESKKVAEPSGNSEENKSQEIAD